MRDPLDRDWSRRDFLRAAGASALGGLVVAGCGSSSGGSSVPLSKRKPGKSLTINSYGGAYQTAIQKDFTDAFTRAHGIKVDVVTAVSTQALSRLEEQGSSAPFDLIDWDIPAPETAKARGLLQKLDRSLVPNMNSLYPVAVDPDGYWVANLLASTGIAYNTKYVKTPPTKWTDLWRPEFHGHVALPAITQTTGWEFLIAAARAFGGSEKNIDPGFKAVQRLKSGVVSYYSEPDGLATLLTSGNAWIGPWYNDRTAVLKASGAPVEFVAPDDGPIAIIDAWSVPKKASNPVGAMQFLNYVLSPAAQARFDKTVFEGPSNRKVVLPPKFRSAVPYGAAAAKKLYSPDWTVVAENMPSWTNRWQQQIQG